MCAEICRCEEEVQEASFQNLQVRQDLDLDEYERMQGRHRVGFCCFCCGVVGMKATNEQREGMYSIVLR